MSSILPRSQSDPSAQLCPQTSARSKISRRDGCAHRHFRAPEAIAVRLAAIGSLAGSKTAKKKHAVAIAEGGRTGEVRFLGEVENNPPPIERTIKRLAERYDRPPVCFEAGSTGYGLYRQIQALGRDCMMIAPALIPKRSGERVKTNRRDAVTLAAALSGRRTDGRWAPDPAHEAARDLVRAREAGRTIFAASASSCSPSCCGTAGSIAEEAIGRWRIGAGWPTRRLSMRRSRSSFRRPSRRSKILSSACAGSRSNSP
jgi:hypothetical protein